MDIFQELNELADSCIFVQFQMESVNFHEYEYIYAIQWVTAHQQTQKRPAIEYKNSFAGGGSTYGGTYQTPQKALESGIDYAKKFILPHCKTIKVEDNG